MKVLTILTIFIILEYSTFQALDLLSGLSDTRAALRDIHTSEMTSIGRDSDVRYCYHGNRQPTEDNIPEDNSFLDMANFLEYIQMTNIDESTVEDALAFFNVSTAAYNNGNLIVAQENFARACSALNNNNSSRRRAKRSHGESEYGASDLFSEWKRQMGEDDFRRLLHLDEEVTFVFVIDTSSSMSNDMGKVKDYINTILLEQSKVGARVTYVVGTYAETYRAFRSMEFTDKAKMMAYINDLRPSTGGDCRERTCDGLMRSMFSSNFLRQGRSAFFVFTDASSKDCANRGWLIQNLNNVRAPVFFILFDSCEEEIDTHFVDIAARTKGFCLFIRDNGVYNITDTVHGSFGMESLIVGHSGLYSQTYGQGLSHYGANLDQYGYYHNGRKKRDTQESMSEKKFLIDDLITSFRVYVEVTPSSMLDEVSLHKPVDWESQENCADSNLNILKSTADNALVFGVEAFNCPCVGDWVISHPPSARVTYTVKSLGKYALSFDAFFVDELRSGQQRANYSPCLGVEEHLVVKVKQGEHIMKESLSLSLISGEVVLATLSPQHDPANPDTYVAMVTLSPEIDAREFTVLLEGRIIGGNPFRRHSPITFTPTESCLRIQSVDNHYALLPNKMKTHIKLHLVNNSPVAEFYSFVCQNSANHNMNIGRPQSRTYLRRFMSSGGFTLYPGEEAVLYTSVDMRRREEVGKTVFVTCTATSSTEELIEIVALTEMSEIW